jgi:hypothetical protein
VGRSPEGFQLVLHLTTKKTCVCGHVVTVCIHVPSLPDPATLYRVYCPMNGSELQVAARELQSVDTCPPNAVGEFKTSAPSRNRWWRFWG